MLSAQQYRAHMSRTRKAGALMRGSDFGWDYPPGVTGNEPQITGEWPCEECDGAGPDEDEDGKHGCRHCDGSGIEPESSDDEDMPESLGDRVKEEEWRA